MRLADGLKIDLSSRRAQHLVYLIHVWICVPIFVWWVVDHRVERILGHQTFLLLRVVVGLTVAYIAGRTWLAWVDPPRLKWWYIFPPVDVALITLILCITHLGPMSNITLLFFLPIVQASGSLNVRWAACVGLMVVAGTVLSTLTGQVIEQVLPRNPMELLHNDPLNVVFRVLFLVVISSLMAYQALIAASYRERLGIEADRNRIAMEMHDGVQGHLIAIASQLELISRIAGQDSGRAIEVAQEGRDTARKAADELRFLVQRLRNPALEAGFVAALRQFSHNICDRNGIRLVFEVSGTNRPLPAEVENSLFRIAQEALANIVKHSEANSVTVDIGFSEGSIRLSITDDGTGFDSAKATGGIGLENMKKRAADHGGELTIETAPESGTRLVATFIAGVKHGGEPHSNHGR